MLRLLDIKIYFDVNQDVKQLTELVDFFDVKSLPERELDA